MKKSFDELSERGESKLAPSIIIFSSLNQYLTISVWKNIS